MALLNRYKKSRKAAAPHSIPQSGRSPNNLYAGLAPQGLSRSQIELYSSLRESIPIIDAAIFKLVRLTLGFSIECSDKKAQEAVDVFCTQVRVNGFSYGLDAFLSAYFEQLLTFGTAAGEILIGSGCIAALYNADISNLELKEGSSPLDIRILARSSAMESREVPHPDRILLSVLNPAPGQIYGNSLLKGLPFVSSVLMKIYNTIGVNWERVGNIRFAVNYKPSSDSMDKAFAKERAMQIASQWRDVMSSPGSVKDFVCVGDVGISVIGADGQIPDSDIPVRQMLEQIIAKTGLPPFMLGLSWSSTERMSAQQADILTSELEAYRRILSPVIHRILTYFFALSGFSGGFEIKWNDITMQDESELARARLYNAQAKLLENKKEVEEN